MFHLKVVKMVNKKILEFIVRVGIAVLTVIGSYLGASSGSSF